MNKTIHMTFFLGALLSLAVVNVPAADPQFGQIWETSGFLNPESVVVDPAENLLYVSNVNGDPAAKDGNGFISKVAIDGQVLALEWVKGLNAPKGLAVVGGKLFTADVDTVLEIDTKTGAITNRYQDAGAKFLNDVAAASDGTIYVSDTGANRIYRLQNGKLEVWLEDAKLDAPNGLLIEKDRIMVGSMGDFVAKRPGQFLTVSMADKKVTVANSKASGVFDAVEAAPGGDYYLSDWPAGKVLSMKPNGDIATLLEIKMGTADFTYNQDRNTLFIPLMMDGKVVAYKGGATK